MSRKKQLELRERRRRERQRLMIGGAVLVVIALVVIAYIVIESANQSSQQAATQTQIAQTNQAPTEEEAPTSLLPPLDARRDALAEEVDAAVEAAEAIIDDNLDPEPVLVDEAAAAQWESPPEMAIDTEKTYLATFVTEQGPVVVELLDDFAPVTVNNFVFLAEEGYYDNTTFHRVLEDFMAQGGDPTGTGRGGPGYRFQDETDNGLAFDEPGLLAMANSGPNTNGSQFFITFDTPTHLTGAHTIFGRVLEGMDVLDAITRRDPAANPDFTGDVLLTVIITEVSEAEAD